MSAEFEAIDAAVRGSGLVPRGGFHPHEEDAVPPLPDGTAARTVVLVGNVGESTWTAFLASPESKARHDPLDTWSLRVVGELAGRVGAHPLFPFGGPPYLPFMRWAERAESVFASVMGPLIHPDFGLWHAYRGALAFSRWIDLPPRETRARPCDTCADRPCLSTCPVDAFSASGYDVSGCAGHLASDGGVDCMSAGCLARRACPVGQAYRYGSEQAGFHMRAFLAARKKMG